MTPLSSVASTDRSIMMSRAADDSQHETGVSVTQITETVHSIPDLNRGEMFGIGFAVGMVVASLFLVGAYVFARHRKTKTSLGDVVDTPSRNNGSVGNSRHELAQVQGQVSIPAAIEETGSKRIICTLYDLPQSECHSTLTQGFLGLNVAIENFIFNFIHEDPVPEAAFSELKLANLAPNTTNDREWAPTLANIDIRDENLRCFIAKAIFRCMDPECDPSLSILPPGISPTYAQILAKEEGRNQHFLRATWRQVTGRLLRIHLSDRLPPPIRFDSDDPRRPNIRTLTSGITEAIGPLRGQRPPWTVTRSEQDCFDYLESIIEDAATLALTLFSQEDEAQVDWALESTGFVVFPGLKMTNFNKKTREMTTTQAVVANVI